MNPSQTQAHEAEELNLQALLGALARRWPWIVAGVAAGGVVAAWSTSRIKPVWEGGFQIVLASTNGGASSVGSLLGGNSVLASLAGLGRGSDQSSERETQVQILQSPSVLRPVFEQVRARKAASGVNVSSYDFDDWISSLSIELNKGTSVLNIHYRDTDQSLILPVLRQISSTYQAYSSQERSESLNNGLAFAQTQLNRFRARAEESNRALDSFRIRYGIAATGNTISGGSVDVGKLLNQSAADLQGSAIQIQGGGGSQSPSGKGDPLGQLAAINQELIRARQTFTDNDPTIQALIRERNALQRYIESTAIGTLALPGKQSLSKEEAQSIVLRYQELDRTATRNNSTLDSLESAVLSLQLEQARATKPWQLISTPTLQDRPVAPRPARSLAIGLAAGFLAGCAAALLADRRSGRVFNPGEINDALSSEPLAVLHGSNCEAWQTSLELLACGPLVNARTLALTPIGLNTNSQHLISLQQHFQALMPNTQVSLCSNLMDASRQEKQLLVTGPGAATHAQLAQISQQLKLMQQPISGWLFIEAP